MRAGFILCLAALGGLGHATGLSRVKFLVYDPATRLPANAARVVVTDDFGHKVASIVFMGSTSEIDLGTWQVRAESVLDKPTLISLSVGTSVTLTQQTQPPVKEIHIHV